MLALALALGLLATGATMLRLSRNERRSPNA
jgi:hypothetical protein